MIPCDLALCCQIYKTAAAELAKTCPVCLHALEDFNTVYAGAPLSEALVRYGNSTLNLLRVANTTLSSQQKPGSAGLSAMASNASLLLRAAGASSGQGRMWGHVVYNFGTVQRSDATSGRAVQQWKHVGVPSPVGLGRNTGPLSKPYLFLLVHAANQPG